MKLSVICNNKNTRVIVLTNSWVLAFQICWWTYLWFIEEHKLSCHIIMPFTIVRIIFFNRFCSVETQLEKLNDNCEWSITKNSCNNMHDSDYVISCTMETRSISNTFNKLLLQSDLHPTYIQTIYNGEEERINKNVSTYVEPLLNDINHPALVQYWKLNMDVTGYEKELMIRWADLQIKKKLISIIENLLANDHQRKHLVVAFSLHCGE